MEQRHPDGSDYEQDKSNEHHREHDLRKARVSFPTALRRSASEVIVSLQLRSVQVVDIFQFERFFSHNSHP
jgi:hypothetical protein